MKKFEIFILFLFLIFSGRLYSQSVKSDIITKKFGGVVVGKVVEITKSNLVYKALNEEGSPTHTIPLTNVAKIEYADGTVNDFSQKTINEKKNTPSKQNKPTSIDNKPNANLPISKNTSLDKAAKKQRKKTVIGIGLNANYIPSFLSETWAADNDSTGFRQGIGGDINIDYYLSKAISVGLNIGYNQWQLQRNYVLKEVKTSVKSIQYSSLDKFSLIPIQASLKLFITKRIYISPFVSYNLITTELINKEGVINNPFGTSTINSSINKIGYGGSIGYIIYQPKYLIDISANYKSIQLEQFRNISEPLSFGGFRIGIGFDLRN